MRRALPTFLLAAFLAGCSSAPEQTSEAAIDGTTVRLTVNTVTGAARVETLAADLPGGRYAQSLPPPPGAEPGQPGRYTGRVGTVTRGRGRPTPRLRLTDQDSGRAWILDDDSGWRRE